MVGMGGGMSGWGQIVLSTSTFKKEKVRQKILFCQVHYSSLMMMQLHTGAEHFGNVIKRGIAKRGCS
jgi:hypothetical protein